MYFIGCPVLFIIPWMDPSILRGNNIRNKWLSSRKKKKEKKSILLPIILCSTEHSNSNVLLPVGTHSQHLIKAHPSRKPSSLICRMYMREPKKPSQKLTVKLLSRNLNYSCPQIVSTKGNSTALGASWFICLPLN